MYGVEFGLAAADVHDDSEMLSTMYSTMSYCLHRDEGDKEEVKKDSVCEKWNLLREFPLHLSEDENERGVLMEGEEPLKLRVGSDVVNEV